MPCLNSCLTVENYTVTILATDWDSETKVAMVAVDWAIENMSATFSPSPDYISIFKDDKVQGVFCYGIINGYLLFKSGSGATLGQTIDMNVTAVNDGLGNIINSSIVRPNIDGMFYGADYRFNVSNGEASLSEFVPTIKRFEVPPYDNEGHPVTWLGQQSAGSSINNSYIEEVYLINNVKNVGLYVLNSSPKLKKVFVGKQLTFIGNSNAFNSCPLLAEVIFERGRTEVLQIVNPAGAAAFSGAGAITELTIPPLVSLGSAFGSISTLKKVRYESEQSPAYAFGNCSVDEFTFTQDAPVSLWSPTTQFRQWATAAPYTAGKYIFVPYDKLTTYTSASGWANYAGYICGFGKFTAGATLPTQTTDEAWSLTWYATKEDLKAGTNAITTAPSTFDNEYGEIYCTKSAA